MSDLRERAAESAPCIIDEVDAERLLEGVMSWILGVNERRLKKHERRTVRKIAWWTDELERMKKNVRKCSLSAGAEAQ